MGYIKGNGRDRIRQLQAGFGGPVLLGQRIQLVVYRRGAGGDSVLGIASKIIF